MTTSGGVGLLRAREGPERATFLELFLDLVYVFALTRFSQRLIEDFTTDRRIVLTELGQTTLLLLALWLVWLRPASSPPASGTHSSSAIRMDAWIRRDSGSSSVGPRCSWPGGCAWSGTRSPGCTGPG